MNIKNSLFAIGGIILAFITPIIPLILIVGVAISMDTCIGIFKAKKLKEPITSRKMSKLISKLVLYQSAIILFYAIEKFILGDIIGYFITIPLILTKVIATTLLFIELTSINESYKIISGVNIWAKFKELLSRGKDIKKDVKQLLNENDIKLNKIEKVIDDEPDPHTERMD